MDQGEIKDASPPKSVQVQLKVTDNRNFMSGAGGSDEGPSAVFTGQLKAD